MNPGDNIANDRLLQVNSSVIQQVRQHAHSSSDAEICGVLLGVEAADVTLITAAIAGANADQGGAHVTFTQDTWEHIYKVKDKDYAEERILGWYHSHPGFGVFLSEHDTFIHRNFFSATNQVAWVYDPHSEEEGCFGWKGDRIQRLARFAVVDEKGGVFADQSGKAEPSVPEREKTSLARKSDKALVNPVHASDPVDQSARLARILALVSSHLVVVALGFVLAWYVFPRIMLVPVPVDPRTGRPLRSLRTNDGGTAFPGPAVPGFAEKGAK